MNISARRTGTAKRSENTVGGCAVARRMISYDGSGDRATGFDAADRGAFRRCPDRVAGDGSK